MSKLTIRTKAADSFVPLFPKGGLKMWANIEKAVTSPKSQDSTTARLAYAAYIVEICEEVLYHKTHEKTIGSKYLNFKHNSKDSSTLDNNYRLFQDLNTTKESDILAYVTSFLSKVRNNPLRSDAIKGLEDVLDYLILPQQGTTALTVRDRVVSPTYPEYHNQMVGIHLLNKNMKYSSEEEAKEVRRKALLSTTALPTQARIALAAMSYAHHCKLTGRNPLKGVEAHAIYQSTYLRHISTTDPLFTVTFKDEINLFPNPTPIPIEVLRELSTKDLAYTSVGDKVSSSISIDADSGKFEYVPSVPTSYEDWYYGIGIMDIPLPFSKEEAIQILDDPMHLDWTAGEALLYSALLFLQDKQDRYKNDACIFKGAEGLTIGITDLVDVAYKGARKGSGGGDTRAIKSLRQRGVLSVISKKGNGHKKTYKVGTYGFNFTYAVSCMPQDQYDLYMKYTRSVPSTPPSMFHNADMVITTPFLTKSHGTYEVTPSYQGDTSDAYPDNMPSLYSELKRIEEERGPVSVNEQEFLPISANEQEFLPMTKGAFSGEVFSELQRLEAEKGPIDGKVQEKQDTNVIVIPVPNTPFTQDFLTNLLSKGEIAVSLVDGEAKITFTLNNTQK